MSKRNFFLVTAIVFTTVALIVWLRQKGKVAELPREPVFVDTSEDIASLGYTGQRKIVQDRDGNTYVGYRKEWNGSDEIFVAKITQQGNTMRVNGADRPIAPVGSGANQRVPSLAIDHDDRIHAVWYGSDSRKEADNRQVKYAVSSDHGASWSSWKNIAPVDGYDGEDFWQEHPSISVGSDGTFFVVWEGRDKDYEKQQIKLVKSTDGGATWSRWINVRPNKDRTQSRPSLVEAKDGRLYLFMYSSLGNTAQQIAYSVSADKGATWSDWQSISDPMLDSRHVSVTTDGSGRVWAVWRAGKENSQPANLFFSVMEDGHWPKPALVSVSSASQFFPSIGIDAEGKVWVAWMESSDTSDFPREHPESGTIHTASFSDQQKAFTPVRMNQNGMYPVLPLSVASQTLPLVYLHKDQSNDRFLLQLLGL